MEKSRIEHLVIDFLFCRELLLTGVSHVGATLVSTLSEVEGWSPETSPPLSPSP